jgi:hypothetical protein
MLLATEALIQSQGSACRTCDRQSETGTGFSPASHHVTNAPCLSITPSEVRSWPYQLAHFHKLGRYFTSDLAFGCTLSKANFN